MAAVCPAIDLAPGADALHEPLNRAYEWRFLRGLMARYRRKAKLFPGIYASQKAIGPVRSIREFDDKIVARYWGFRDADDYYDRAASARVVDRIAVPTLILHAQDDPFIRLLPETRAKLLANPHIDLCRDPPRRPLRLPLPRSRQRDSLGRGDGDAVPAGGDRRIAWKLTGSSKSAADAPVIEARWPGFVDLRRNPERAGNCRRPRNFPRWPRLWQAECRRLAGLDLEMRFLAAPGVG